MESNSDGVNISAKIRDHDSVCMFILQKQILKTPGGWGTPIIFSWGCAAGTLRTLAYTRPC